MESDPLHLPERSWTNPRKSKERHRQMHKDRLVFVPDTVEWSGRRPDGEEWRHEPIPFMTPCGWELQVPCRDKPRGRLVSISTCTGLQTPTMPYTVDAWAFLTVIEAVPQRYIENPRIARVDFARDLYVHDSVAYLRAMIEKAVTSDEIEIHKKGRQLGITYLGVAGADRLRIYHKGLEFAKKHNRPSVSPVLKDVVRVELQYRKGQLADEQRVDINALRNVRVRPEPSESDVPTIRTRTRWRGRSQTLPQKALEATEAAERFLEAHGYSRLGRGFPAGNDVPAPAYGDAPATARRA